MKNFLKVFLFYFIVGLSIYFNSLNNKFLIDDAFFINNPVSSSAKYIWSQWNPYREQAEGVMDSQQNLGYYRPMAHMVYDLLYAVFAHHFWRYHLLNIFLFIFASLLIYLFIQRLTGKTILAFLTGFFYLIHPINGIVVNYASACVFAFQVIFMLGAILLLEESLDKESNRVFYFLSLVCTFLSLFWNESGIMIPFYVSAYTIVFRKESVKQKVLYLFPYYLIVFAYIVFRFYFISINELILKPLVLWHVNGGMYWANLCHGFIWYLSRLIYPQGIVMAWAAPLIHDHMAGYLWESSLLLILVSILYGRLAKECQLAFLWMIVGFMPVCVAAFRKPENGVQIEPHWFIFSSIGFFILMAYLLWVFLDKKKGFGLMLLFILTCTWGTISHANNQLWADQKTYSLYWSREVPSIKWINYYIASAYYDEGKLKESMRYLKRGLSGYPSDAELYLCMGVIEDGEHNFKAAESDDYRALESNPRSSFAYNNLAEIYLEEGQWEKAKALFHLALAYNPLMLDARVGLATIYFNHGQYQEANQLCQFNLSITKDDPQSLSLLMDICLRQKDFLNLRKYAKIFINAGSDPKALTVLGIVLAQQNIPDLALDSFSKVMRIAPDYKDGYVATGTLFANLGKYDEAIHIWKIGLTIDPADQRLRSDVNRAIKMNKSHVQS